MIQELIKSKGLDAIILFNKSPPFKRMVGADLDHGLMVITPKKKFLFVSPLNSSKIPGFEIIVWKKIKEDFKQFVHQEGLKKIGIDAQSIFLRQKLFLSKYVKTVDVSEMLETSAMEKTPAEIGKITQACKITDRIFRQLLDDFNFKTEEEIAKYIKIKLIEHGAEHSFEPIIASGANAAVPHHVSGGKLKKGFMVLDFGARYQGYISDMTRTIFLGSPTVSQASAYEKLLGIQESCIEMARPGLKASELHDHCVKLMGKDSKYFTTALGHGIGVEVHESPYIGPKSKHVLSRNQVFTIEPGYYNVKMGMGIRIEDDMILGSRKEILTKSPKELILVDAS